MKLKIVLIALAFLLPITYVNAEEGLAPCFDYYKFGSVQVDISPVNKDTLSGTDLVFNGNVRNTNTYPIIDGSVYVKIFRKDAKSNVQANGWELVDQFFAKKDINIDGKKQSPISFTWKVPAYSIAGEYKVATYFVTQDRFNLSGLSFTDDITGTTIPFKVTSEQTKGVTFDRESVKVNGQKFMFAAFTPKVDTKKVDIKFDLKNELASAKTAEVIYTLYTWDALRKENIISTKKETISLKANETKNLSFTVTDSAHPVYYLVVESKVDGVKSIVSIRFARQGVEEARLNFPALNSYPLKEGVEATMFSCFHNSGLGESVEDGKAVMTLTDEKGKVIDTYTYTGSITGSMMAIKKSFIPSKDNSDITLTAELYVKDKLVEKSVTHYECSKLDSQICADDAISGAGETSRVMTYVVIILALFVLIVAVFAYHGHMKRKDVGVAALLFVSTLGMGMFQVNAKLAGAGISSGVGTLPVLSIPANSFQGTYKFSYSTGNDPLAVTFLKERPDKICTPTTRNLNCFSVDNGQDMTLLTERGVRIDTWAAFVKSTVAAYITVDNFNFNYNYGAEIINVATNSIIPNGTAVQIGTKIKFRNVAFDKAQIGWVLSGSTYDTPFAYWGDGTVPQCQSTDQFAQYVLDNGRYYTVTIPGKTSLARLLEPTFTQITRAYLPMVVQKPAITIDTTGTTANLAANSDGSYTVNGPGDIKAKVNFAKTSATAYFQYNLANVLKYQSTQAKKYNIFTGTQYNDLTHFNVNNGKSVTVAPMTQDVFAAVPITTNSCKVATQYSFDLDPASIQLNLFAAPPSNLPPNKPSFTTTSSCLSAPTSVKITPATPIDPDTGDTVTYQYQVDNGAGYGPTQTAPGINFDVYFSTAGVKKIRIQAVDNKGAVSGWVEKSFSVSSCDSISVYCYDPILVNGNQPQYTVEASSPDKNMTYTYSWTYPQRNFTLSGTNNNILTGEAMSPGQTIPGPTVKMDASNGTTQTLNCPSASIGSTGVNTVPGSCVVTDFDLYTPTWTASMSGGKAPYTYTWSPLSKGQANGNTFTYNDPLTSSQVANEIKVTVTDSSSPKKTTPEISCEAKGIDDVADIKLRLMDDKGNISDSQIVVRRGEKATSLALFAGITNTCNYSSAITGKLIKPPFDPAGGASQLDNHELDTSVTGDFDFNVRCLETSGNNYAQSNSVTLRVIADKKIEEI